MHFAAEGQIKKFLWWIISSMNDRENLKGSFVEQLYKTQQKEDFGWSSATILGPMQRQ